MGGLVTLFPNSWGVANGIFTSMVSRGTVVDRAEFTIPVLLGVCRRRAGWSEKVQNFADVVFSVHRMPERHLRVHGVPVASPVPRPGQVVAVLELGDDALRRPLSDTDYVGDFPKSGVGIFRHAQEHMGVVGEKRPIGHEIIVEPRTTVPYSIHQT